MLTNPPLALYVHIPWCIKKCPYCDFNSHAIKQGKTLADIPEDVYVERLLEDLARQTPSVWGRKLHSIFIGGGTPSLFSAEAFDRLISGIRALIPFEANIEITMEANPGTFEAEKFLGFCQAGINRLSIGVQSFTAEHLTKLGRVHNPEQAIQAAEFAAQVGFDSFNLDLMHGLPNQNLSQALDDLQTAIKLKPQHISWYQLTLEPNTEFYAKPPKLPQDETLWDIQEAGQKLLVENGYGQYETSAYAKDIQFQAKHNLNYWQFGDYLGIGAGAHGKITRLDLNQVLRTTNKRHPKDYLALDWSQVFTEKRIEKHELPFEFMLNALRLIDGVPTQLYLQRTGLLLADIQPMIKQAITDELLANQSDFIKPSDKGALFLNELLQRFMLEDNSNGETINIRAL